MTDLIGMGAHDLYDWAALAGALAFATVELMLLEIRRRSILGYLGQS